MGLLELEEALVQFGFDVAVDLASVMPEVVEAFRIPALERTQFRAGRAAFDQFTETLCNPGGGLLVFEVRIPRTG